jgi:hypothetical protein
MRRENMGSTDGGRENSCGYKITVQRRADPLLSSFPLYFLLLCHEIEHTHIDEWTLKKSLKV